jgi:excisionase family DNA binding protein
VLTVREVAVRLSCSPATVYSLINSGKLRHYRIRGIRVSEDFLAEFLSGAERMVTIPPLKGPRRPRPKFKHLKL